MLRTQLCRPNLCGNRCEILQEWDDADDPPVVRNLGMTKRCHRHHDLVEHEALAAIAEQDRLEGKVWAAVSRIVGVQDTDNPDPTHIHGDHVAAGLSMADDGTLLVEIPQLDPAHAKKLRGAVKGEKIRVK